MTKKGKFERGVSGNPAGRPKFSRNWRTLIGEALEETVTIKEDGKARRVKFSELVMKSFIKQFLNGNPAYIEFLLGGFTKVDPAKETFILRMGKDLNKARDPDLGDKIS